MLHLLKSVSCPLQVQQRWPHGQDRSAWSPGEAVTPPRRQCDIVSLPLPDQFPSAKGNHVVQDPHHCGARGYKGMWQRVWTEGEEKNGEQWDNLLQLAITMNNHAFDNLIYRVHDMLDTRNSVINKLNMISAFNEGYRCVCVCVYVLCLVAQPCLTATPWTIAPRLFCP